MKQLIGLVLRNGVHGSSVRRERTPKGTTGEEISIRHQIAAAQYDDLTFIVMKVY
jgi:hypothetical protein